MFHRELKINYGMLGDLISNIESYQSALSVMKQSVEKIWELLEESSGEAYEGLEERKETILGQISSCEEELTDLHDLLAGYSYDMQSVIAPVDGEQTMVVDRNDIWFNMQSILSACDRIAAMVYNVNVPWLGTTYTAFAKEEVKEKETKYYNKLEEVQQKIQKKYQDSIAGYKDELVKLYEDKVIVYENTDDVYASKVSKDYYPKYTSLGEGILNVFEWLGDAVTGFVGGVIEGVIGVIDGIGEFLFGIGEFAVSECVVLVNKGMGSEPPDWALKNVKGMKEQVGAILDDPMLLVEGMAQGISDTYESEGIWYCAGYAVGTYAGTKGIAEAGKAVKGKVKVKGKVGESGINSYADFSKAVSDIGTRSDLTDAQKIKELQKLFENSNYKADINVPSNIQYVKGFDMKGNVIYDWPPKLGFDESTIKPITRTDGLSDTWDRYGYMGGSNFADVPSTGKYTYSERAIPYVENEAAYHTGTFNNVTYFDKIDAIKNGDIDTFNALLHNEGISRWDLDDFEELCDSYDSFISKANKELGDSVDATYGIKGQAAEWGNMTGGAGQIVTPFGGDVLEKIGILKEN